MASESDELGNTTSYTYDAEGHRLTSVDPRAAGGTASAYTTTYTFDRAGRTATMVVPGRGTTTYTHDADGKRTKVQDERGGQELAGFDRDGRRISATDADGGKTTYAYDPDGNLVGEVEPRGNVIGATPSDFQASHAYDANGRRVSTVLPLGNTTTFGYDADGNQVWVTDPRGNAVGASPGDYRWHYTYDANGRRSRITDPTGRTVAYGYDPSGNRSSRQDGFGTTTYAYDPANRLQRTTYPTPTGSAVTRTYDAADNLIRVEEPVGTTTTSFNRANWLTASHGPYSSVDYTAFDQAGNATSTMLASGVYTSTWRADNQLSTRTQSGGTTSLGYTTAGQHDQTVHDSGLAADKDLTLAGRPEELTLTPPSSGSAILNQQVIRDAAGRVVEVKDLLTGATDHTYTFDRNGRVTAETYTVSGTTHALSYTYDLAGNRTSRTTSAGATTYAYDSAGRITGSIEPGGGVTTYTYDASGNRTRKTTPSSMTFYSWRPDSKLASMTIVDGANTTNISYEYTYRGELVQRQRDTDVRKYSYENGRLDRITDALGQPRATFTYDREGRPHSIQVSSPGGVPAAAGYYYEYDEGNSVSAIRNGAGTPAIEFGYDAFGRTVSSKTGSAWDERLAINPVRWTRSGIHEPTEDLYIGRGNSWDPGLAVAIDRTGGSEDLGTEPGDGDAVRLENLPVICPHPDYCFSPQGKIYCDDFHFYSPIAWISGRIYRPDVPGKPREWVIELGFIVREYGWAALGTEEATYRSTAYTPNADVKFHSGGPKIQGRYWFHQSLNRRFWQRGDPVSWGVVATAYPGGGAFVTGRVTCTVRGTYS